VGTVLVVSPHLDDAVLSIGGSIAAWTSTGTRVVIASVYTTGPALDEIAPSMRRFADYATRRAEDIAACSTVGAEVRRLDQVERAFRRPFLTGWSFFSTPPDRAGFATLEVVTRALAALDELDPERILIPFGIGNHVDHVEAMVAAVDWTLARGWLDRVWFYEDFYALSNAMRRAHPIASRRQWRGIESPLLRARRLAVIFRTIAAARRGPSITTYWPAALRCARWYQHTVDVRAHERTQLAAIARYPSQIRAFGGLSGITRALRTYHALWGGAEPFWIPTLAR
jgi:LmbE family N-acetylglucosaminyl deacetylase